MLWIYTGGRHIEHTSLTLIPLLFPSPILVRRCICNGVFLLHLLYSYKHCAVYYFHVIIDFVHLFINIKFYQLPTKLYQYSYYSTMYAYEYTCTCTVHISYNACNSTSGVIKNRTVDDTLRDVIVLNKHYTDIIYTYW